MKMSDIDDKILAALDSDERELMEPYSQPMGLFGMLNSPLRGDFGPLAVVAFVFMFVALGVLVYSAIRFFPEPELLPKLNWLAIGLTMLIILGLLRIWYFMEISRLSIIREVKRLELQVSLLSKKLG
jgi:hypothetical protein